MFIICGNIRVVLIILLIIIGMTNARIYKYPNVLAFTHVMLYYSIYVMTDACKYTCTLAHDTLTHCIVTCYDAPFGVRVCNITYSYTHNCTYTTVPRIFHKRNVVRSHNSFWPWCNTVPKQWLALAEQITNRIINCDDVNTRRVGPLPFTGPLHISLISSNAIIQMYCIIINVIEG